MTDSAETPDVQPLQLLAPFKITRHENFESWYANNIQLYPSDFDLRMVFGELDVPTMTIQQHTAMTVSWLQAKLMHYFLSVQLGAHELTYGKIPVPQGSLPPEPQPPTGELADDPGNFKLYEYIKKMREQFIESLGQ